jgi:hypothetical protein
MAAAHPPHPFYCYVEFLECADRWRLALDVAENEAMRDEFQDGSAPRNAERATRQALIAIELRAPEAVVAAVEAHVSALVTLADYVLRKGMSANRYEAFKTVGQARSATVAAFRSDLA